MEENVIEQNVVETKKKKVSPFEKRIHEIDFIRGFMIVIVVMDHLFWNLGHFGELWHIDWMEGFFQDWYWVSIARMIIQPLALMIFCFISGVSCAFSKNNWKRAIENLILWLIILIGSHILCENIIIDGYLDLNIIGVLGFSTLLYCFFQKRSWKGILAAILGFGIISVAIGPILGQTIMVNFGAHDLNRTATFVPLYNYQGLEYLHYNGNNYVFGMSPNCYLPLFWEPASQADFVPLFPYVIFFFAGALFAYFFYKKKKQSLIKRKFNWERPICFIGRHTLVIYLSHMLILAGIFRLIDYFVR